MDRAALLHRAFVEALQKKVARRVEEAREEALREAAATIHSPVIRNEVTVPEQPAPTVNVTVPELPAPVNMVTVDLAELGALLAGVARESAERLGRELAAAQADALDAVRGLAELLSQAVQVVAAMPAPQVTVEAPEINLPPRPKLVLTLRTLADGSKEIVQE